MDENRWFIIEVKKVKNEKSYNVTLGHSMEKPIGDPIKISETKFWSLAEELLGRTQATPHRLIGKSFPRTSDSPSFDLTQFVV